MATWMNRRNAFVGGGLAVVLAVAIGAAVLSSGDESETPTTIGVAPTSQPEATAMLALARPDQPLTVRLSAGTAQSLETAEPIAVVAGEPLDADAVAAVIARLPEWVVPDDDRLDFNRPAGTLTPPLVGDTIDVPFPPESIEFVPEVVEGPLEVLRYQPEGSVEIAPYLSVTFNQPMVPLTTVEQLNTLDVPVVMTPELPGRWQWIGTRTLRFEHDPDLFDRLPMATDYRIEIPAGTVSETGGELASAVIWEFNTPPVQVESFQPQHESLTLEPVFLVTFNQTIDSAAVLETINVTADGESQALRLATDEEITADEEVGPRIGNLLEDRWLAFRTVDALEPDSSLTITIGPETPSAEGPLLTSGQDVYTARTYAPLQIRDWSCREDYRCEPGWGMWIDFNNPLDADAFDESWITIEPEIPGMVVRAEYSSVWIGGATVGGSTYTATVSAGTKDIFGQTLGDDTEVEFFIDDARPRLDQFYDQLITVDPLAPEPSLAVTTVNHDELRVRLFEVDVDDWASYIRYWDRQWDDDWPEPPSGWKEVVDKKIDTNARSNVLAETTIELGDALDGTNGHVIVLVEPTGDLANLSRNHDNYWDNRPAFVWAQATQIGADVFSDGDDSIIWATNLSTGEPMEGVSIEFTGTSTTVTTGTDGLAQAKTPSSSSHDQPIIASIGGDTAFVDFGWNEWSRSDESIWYVFDDRQMYRPGETARIKGWVRRMTYSEDAQLAAVTSGATVDYRAYDWYGNEIGTGTADVNVLGGFDFDIDIPAGANLGEAWIELSLSGAGVSGYHNHSLQVQEFRRPEFEVATRPESAGPYLVDEPATVAVQADYYSGGPLPDAEVEWTVTTREATYSPPNWDDFTFGVWTPWWYFDYGYGYESEGYYDEWWPGYDEPTVETFSGRTDAGGTHYLQMDFDGDGEGLPTTVSAQATVLDVNRQAWSDGTDLLVHPADLYVGLRSTRTYVESGEPIVVAAIVTDIDGAAVADRAVAMEAGRLEWRLVDGRWDEVPVEIEACTVTSSDLPVECEFSTDIGGTYEIVATVTDDAGRSSRSEITRWVSGGGFRPERSVTQEEVTLIPDKQEYAPGDVAEVLVAAPFSPAQGLLTLSRGGIVSTEMFTIEDGSTVLSIPIEDSYIPGIHIQVDLVGVTERTDDKGDPLPDAPDRPAFAVGGLDLQIPPYGRTLNVVAEPADPTTEPGTTTSVDVLVTDAAGSPVADAELAVVVVDEAVLALSSYELPDPLDVFYRPIYSEVWSRYLRSTIELANPDLLRDKADSPVTTTAAAETTAAPEAAGGDSADYDVAEEAMADGRAVNLSGFDEISAELDAPVGDSIEVRTNFDALAFYSPEVNTGPDGTATVEVPLPDSLTRYRVMVVAVAGVDEFGSAESNITARLPLMARPSAPRFLNFGDQFELPVVVQNQTDEDLEVDVVVETANLTLTDGSGRRVTVPANDRVEVRFPATTEDVGTARFRVAAVSTDHADAATVSLPVYTPATTEAFATYGVLDDGAIAQTVLAPEGVFPQFGGLEVNTSSTALQALTDAVIYLNDYRYESADALASRILAISALRDVLEAFEADGLPSATEIEARIDADVDALLGLQTDMGGFAIWKRTNETVPYHSIQATHALVEAKANGYAVPSDRLEQALWYLANIEEFYPSDYSQQLRDTLSSYALHVRNLAGDRDSAKAASLYRNSDNLGLDAVAWLWPVIDDAALETEIERLLNNRATETAGAATFITDYGEDAYLILHSDHRTDAIVLDALISEAPGSDLIPKVVAGLLGGQTRGRWNNVQENSFVLLALNNYFDTFESVTPDFVARIWLGDLYAAEHAFEGRTTDRDATLVPMADLLEQAAAGETSIVVSKDGDGRLYYRLGLRYAPEDLDLDPLDRGFVVERTYEAIDDPDDVTRDVDGTWHIKPGAEVRVRLTMVADSRRTHVALVDPLPAGLEALNPALDVVGPVPTDDDEWSGDTYWWWRWYEHENLRDDRAEAFASILWGGTYEYTYVARATTPGTFVVPPTKAEEIYAPETFGRSSSDIVIVESD